MLLVSCTAQVAAWDADMLSESVSVSTGILALVALVRFTRRPSWPRGGVLALAALWFTMTRPNIFPVLLAWAVALVVVGLLRREALLWSVVAGSFVLMSVYAYVYNVRSDDTWRDEVRGDPDDDGLRLPHRPVRPGGRGRARGPPGHRRTAMHDPDRPGRRDSRRRPDEVGQTDGGCLPGHGRLGHRQMDPLVGELAAPPPGQDAAHHRHAAAERPEPARVRERLGPGADLRGLDVLRVGGDPAVAVPGPRLPHGAV